MTQPILASHPSEAQLEAFIKLFLGINNEPADAQVHSLAAALGLDKETLEAKIYEMLGNCVSDDECDSVDNDVLLADLDEDNELSINLDPIHAAQEVHASTCVCASCGDALAEMALADERTVEAVFTNRVLDGDYDPDDLDDTDVAVNDGPKEVQNIEEDVTTDDGVPEDNMMAVSPDTGRDDGVAIPHIEQFLLDTDD